jgi:hypothetical protein
MVWKLGSMGLGPGLMIQMEGAVMQTRVEIRKEMQVGLIERRNRDSDGQTRLETQNDGDWRAPPIHTS